MDRSGTPPYSHPVYMPVLVIVRILYSGVNKSSVSHFSCKKKPPFFRQSVSMAIWWPVSERIKAPAKVSQHFNATYRNIAGCNMLREFGHPVVTCCDMLNVVGSNLKMIKFFMQHLWMLHDVVVVWPGSCNSVARSLGRFSTRNMSQHVATRWPNACNMLRQPILRSVAFKCCDRLAGASKCWTNKCWDVLR